MIAKMLAEIEDGIGWLTINNPERHNAVSLEMGALGADIIAQFSTDAAVRVIVIRATGDKAWMSGADIGDFTPKPDANPRTTTGFAFYESVYECAKPVVAAMKGYTMGGGVALACACDLRIAATNSIVAIPAGKLGIAYPANFLRWVVDTIGLPNTKEMLFTGNRYGAEDTLRMGLVNQLVAPDDLASVTLEYARTIAQNAPLSVRANKETMRCIVQDSPHWDLARIAELNEMCKNSWDHSEGRSAFAQKRAPVFRGE